MHLTYVEIITGNAKPPTILSQMIAEAREIRENQTYRNNSGNACGNKANQTEESVIDCDVTNCYTKELGL